MPAPWLAAAPTPALGCLALARQQPPPAPGLRLQIAVRTAAAEAGELDEVAFMLFDQQALDAWLAAARAAGLAEEESSAHAEL